MTILHVPCGVLDLDARTFVDHQERVHSLGVLEAAVVRYLSDRAGHAVPRDELRIAVLRQHHLSMSRAIDSIVARIRRKLELDPSNPATLLTVRGCGYQWVCRRDPVRVPDAPVEPRWWSTGALRVDLDRGIVHAATEQHKLSAQQWKLLVLLVESAGLPVPSSELCRQLGLGVRGRRALINTVHRLRAVLEPDPKAPSLIRKSREGYWVACPVPELAVGHMRAVRLLVELAAEFLDAQCGVIAGNTMQARWVLSPQEPFPLAPEQILTRLEARQAGKIELMDDRRSWLLVPLSDAPEGEVLVVCRSPPVPFAGRECARVSRLVRLVVALGV
jgi:DNA-binding response OmpR family regulator